ncbi:MAG: hypothetical protein H0X40_07620 [Chthoniobacterales bacterium]|nr:hypothetical protein [Chthoniobacterales bacterium]
MTIFLTAFAIVTGLVTLLAGALAFNDAYVSRRIERAEADTVPLKIRKSLSYSQFVAGMAKAHAILDEVRFVQDVVVGVHYMGASFGAILAKQLYIPLKIAEIVYATGASTQADRVAFAFDVSDLKGKNVLIVDNSIRTGRTLKMVYDQIAPHALHTKTLVVYKSTAGAVSSITPDIVLFHSDTPIKFLR